MIYTSHSIEETKLLAQQLFNHLSSHPDTNIVALSGDLGSGKTAFTKCLAEILGIHAHITSPTFVIQKKYPIDRKGFPFKTLIHIDAYRLGNADELKVLGFREEAADPSNLILIEWPERVEGMLPEKHISLGFTFINEDTRSIEFPDMIEPNEENRER